MDQAAEPTGAEPTVEEIQDLYLNYHSRAAMANDQLTEMAEAQRQQAEAVVSVIQSLRDQLRASETARLTLEDDNRRLQSRVVDQERQLKHLHTNFARLSEGYSAIMQVVENTHTSSVGLTQRIDAMLLQNDLGIGQRGAPAPARRVSEFRDDVFAHQQRPLHVEPAPHDYRPHAAYGGDQYPAYGSEGIASRPMPSFRNER